MREQFPMKSPGDRLAAAHVNSLSRVCRSVASIGAGGYAMGKRGGTFGTTSGVRIPRLGTFSISTDLEATQGSAFEKMYDIVPRVFDSGQSARADQWGDHDTAVWILDAYDTDLTFSVGDRVDAYYHSQRGVFLPIARGEWCIALTPGGGIPVRNGTTPGSANCGLFHIDANGALTARLNSEGTPLGDTIYHIGTSSAVTGSTYIQYKTQPNGRKVADWEDCAA